MKDLITLLYEAGICPQCGDERQHELTAPQSHCSCGTFPDSQGPGTIQRLRLDLAARNEEIAELRNGDRVILPKSKAHAVFMHKVATHYLENTNEAKS